MTIKICIANQKGGVGKTTTATTLAHGLAFRGHKVLLVDCDPQGQCATFLGLQQDSGVFNILINNSPLAQEARSASSDSRPRNNLWIVPGDKRTATAQIVMSAEGFRLDCLAKILKRADYDFVIFDTSPSVGLLQEAALFASTWLIIPTSVDYPSSEGVAGVLTTLKAVNNKGGTCQLLCILPTMHDKVTRESRVSLEQLHKQLGEAVFQPIHRATILRECAAEGVTIWEKDAKSRAAQEYAELVYKVEENE